MTALLGETENGNDGRKGIQRTATEAREKAGSVCARVCTCVQVCAGEKERKREHVSRRNEEQQRERKAARAREEGAGGGGRHRRAAGGAAPPSRGLRPEL